MIEEIERRRIALGLNQKELCAAADVHETTYGRLKNGVSSGTGSTWSSLQRALRAFEERALAQRAVAP